MFWMQAQRLGACWAAAWATQQPSTGRCTAGLPSPRQADAQLALLSAWFALHAVLGHH